MVADAPQEESQSVDDQNIAYNGKWYVHVCNRFKYI